MCLVRLRRHAAPPAEAVQPLPNKCMRELCLVHGNCQAVPLVRQLAASPAFARNWEFRVIPNYAREAVPDAALQSCTLFLYQHLGEKWGELSSRSLLARLAAGTEALQIPNVFFKGYWPFWSNAFPMNFADAFLEHLVALGLSAPEILRIYLGGNLEAKYDLDAMLAESVAVERSKEEGQKVRTVDFVLERWRREPVFTTVNHPAPVLLAHIADGVLRALGLPPLTPAQRAAAGPLCCDPDPARAFHLPVHPGVAAHHGLAFGGPAERYPVFGKRLTFARYAACYVDCRLAGLDFLAYLHAAPAENAEN